MPLATTGLWIALGQRLEAYGHLKRKDDLVRLVDEWIPAARFVQIVRDGRDVALSHQTMPYGAGNIADCARAWASRISVNAKMDRILGPERYCALRFEDLVSDSETTLARLCRFLGVAFDPAMLRSTARTRYNRCPCPLTNFRQKECDSP